MSMTTWQRFRAALAAIFLRWARRLDPTVIHTDRVPDSVFWQDVIRLVTWAETLPATPGEVKCAQVAARLRLRYPAQSTQTIHWAIERVLYDRVTGA